jgi:hypothetical protein
MSVAAAEILSAVEGSRQKHLEKKNVLMREKLAGTTRLELEAVSGRERKRESAAEILSAVEGSRQKHLEKKNVLMREAGGDDETRTCDLCRDRATFSRQFKDLAV